MMIGLNTSCGLRRMRVCSDIPPDFDHHQAPPIQLPLTISLSRSSGHKERRAGWMEGCPDGAGGSGRRGTVPVSPSSPEPRLPAATLFYLLMASLHSLPVKVLVRTIYRREARHDELAFMLHLQRALLLPADPSWPPAMRPGQHPFSAVHVLPPFCLHGDASLYQLEKPAQRGWPRRRRARCLTSRIVLRSIVFLEHDMMRDWRVAPNRTPQRLSVLTGRSPARRRGRHHDHAGCERQNAMCAHLRTRSMHACSST
ncbi:hypothetical protein PENSPDRAFT_334032 [Peniophora sp. CONT]|nr:hypothetical protein PENSPDRAFT_334032 [Peniophora sp. CONT]